jgi:hypothetical protein
MKNLVKNFIGSVLSVAILFVAFDYVLTGSDVMVSHSTGACVSVENYDGILFKAGEYNCENLPPKYTHIWVK